jgi:hypothetical protein
MLTQCGKGGKMTRHCPYCGAFTSSLELCLCRQREVIRQARKSQDIAELIAKSLREQIARGALVAEVAYMEAV